MYNYRLLNSNGKILGVVSLETEDLPKLLTAGERLILSGDYDVSGNNEFVDFILTPEPAVERTSWQDAEYGNRSLSWP